jgi:hypothetical protein
LLPCGCLQGTCRAGFFFGLLFGRHRVSPKEGPGRVSASQRGILPGCSSRSRSLPAAVCRRPHRGPFAPFELAQQVVRHLPRPGFLRTGVAACRWQAIRRRVRRPGRGHEKSRSPQDGAGGALQSLAVPGHHSLQALPARVVPRPDRRTD